MAGSEWGGLSEQRYISLKNKHLSLNQYASIGVWTYGFGGLYKQGASPEQENFRILPDKPERCWCYHQRSHFKNAQ
jgi:hypothetical protein